MKKSFSLLCFLAAASAALANNIMLSNVSKQSVNTAQHYMMIKFSVSWENSWRDASNRDAAWIFIKYKATGAPGAWSHATLNYVDGINDGHIAAAGAVINASSDGKGVFIARDTNGSGTVNFSDIQLRWNYGADGVTDNALVDISVSAIEMVYVPQGSFWAGDGTATTLHGQFEDGATGSPLQIVSEGALTLGGGTPGSLGNNNRTGMANNGLFSISPVSIDDFDDVTSQLLPAAFPKGFSAFYCMKYEITQGQYADFLNKLSASQFAGRYDAFNYTGNHGGFTATRYNITGTYPNMTTTTPDLPAIYVEWYDAAAYADWAGLRPMTELEYEKACRGFAAPVANEYAWGNANINAANYFPVSNQGQPNESVNTGYSTTSGNAWYDATRAFDAVTRVGIFAAHPSSSGRVTSGATYWGIMEMSGHCWERTVSVGRPESRNFTGTHGDGVLLSNGNATNTDWPGYTAGQGVNTAVGCGYRGGAFNFPPPIQPNLRVSSRILATAFYNVRYYDDAARFVRTAN